MIKYIRNILSYEYRTMFFDAHRKTCASTIFLLTPDFEHDGVTFAGPLRVRSMTGVPASAVAIHLL